MNFSMIFNKKILLPIIVISLPPFFFFGNYTPASADAIYDAYRKCSTNGGGLTSDGVAKCATETGILGTETAQINLPILG